jgi:hypothetical protein
MFGRCREDQDVRVESVHLSAVAVGPNLADEFLGPLWRQARAGKKVLIRSSHQRLVQSCGLFDHDLGPRTQDVRPDDYRYRPTVAGDGHLLACFNTREQFGQ